MPKRTSMVRNARTTPMRPRSRCQGLPREDKETKLCFIGHGLMENRHGLLVDGWVTLADGHAERVAAAHDRASCRSTDSDHTWRRQAYDAEDFVNELTPAHSQAHRGGIRLDQDAHNQVGTERPNARSLQRLASAITKNKADAAS